MRPVCEPRRVALEDLRLENDEVRAIIQARVRTLMEVEGLDPEKGEHLARFVGVSKQTGYNWLAGRGTTPRSLRLLAQAFDTTADYILGLSDEPRRAATPTGAAAQAMEDALREGETDTPPPTAPASRRRRRHQGDSPPPA